MKKNDAFDNSFELHNQGKPLPPGKRLIVTGGEGVVFDVQNTLPGDEMPQSARTTYKRHISKLIKENNELSAEIESWKNCLGEARAVASFWRTVAGIEFLLIVGGILALLGRG